MNKNLDKIIEEQCKFINTENLVKCGYVVDNIIFVGCNYIDSDGGCKYHLKLPQVTFKYTSSDNLNSTNR